MPRARIRYDDRELRRNVDRLDEIYDEMIRFVIDYHAVQGAANMKKNAPWTDRTSAARNGLFTVTDHSPGHYTIVFSHTMHYGFWLEVKFSGRDAVIMPTVKSQGRALMEDIRRKLK